MSLNSKYWGIATLLMIAVFALISKSIWDWGYTDNMGFMSEQRLFLVSFIWAGVVNGGLFWILYEVWDRNISWRIRLF